MAKKNGSKQVKTKRRKIRYTRILSLLAVFFALFFLIRFALSAFKQPEEPQTAVAFIQSDLKEESKKLKEAAEARKEDPDIQTGFITTEAGTQYFDLSGQMLTGLQKIKKSYYYFNEEGYMVKDAMLNVEGLIRYFGPDGVMATGKTKVGDRTLLFDKDGELQIDIEELEKGIDQIVKKYNKDKKGEYSFYFKDIRTGNTLTINNKSYYPCCMIKVPALIGTFQKIYSGELDYMANYENISLMVIMSDNTAYNDLMIQVGEGDGVNGVHFVNDMLAEMGIEETRLHHGLIPGEGYFTDGGDNVSNPVDIGVIFEKLYYGQVISPEASAEMIEWLKLCGDTMELAAGIPEGIPFAHKTGCADDIYHDGGVVYMGDRDYIISLFTAGFGDDRSEMMAEISKYVYEYEAGLF